MPKWQTLPPANLTVPKRFDLSPGAWLRETRRGFLADALSFEIGMLGVPRITRWCLKGIIQLSCRSPGNCHPMSWETSPRSGAGEAEFGSRRMAFTVSSTSYGSTSASAKPWSLTSFGLMSTERYSPRSAGDSR